MEDLNIDIGYKNEVLYQNVKIELPSHGVISIMGDNGSGKSTLYKTLLGIIPPMKGKIPKHLFQKMSIISDYVHLPEEVTVKDILNLLGDKCIDFAKENYLEFYIYIDQYKTQRLKSLSSGQRRIVEIFTVLASGKTIIVLDEASNSLDFSNRELFLSHVKKLALNNILFFHTSHEVLDIVYLGGTIYGLFKQEKKIVRFVGDITSENLHNFMGYGVNK